MNTFALLFLVAAQGVIDPTSWKSNTGRVYATPDCAAELGANYNGRMLWENNVEWGCFCYSNPGATCAFLFPQCPTGYVYHGATTPPGYCAAACTSAATCQDGNVCNGAERCASGRCAPGTALTCPAGDACNTVSCDPTLGCVTTARVCPDDGRACTRESCDPVQGCVTALDPTQCTCGAGPSTVTLGFAKDWDLGALGCPLIGGDFTDSASLTVEGSAALPTCANDCQSTLSLGGTGEIVAGFCKNSVSMPFTAQYSRSETQCPVCDSATCGSGCSGTACVTQSATGSASVKYSQFVGESTHWGNRLLSFSTKCGFTLSASVGTRVTYSETDGTASCVACDQCSALDVAATVGAGAEGDCYVEEEALGHKTALGCEGCATFEAQVSAGRHSQAGACGAASCTSGSATASAAFHVGSHERRVGWWKTHLECEGRIEGCAETTCGSTPTCADGAHVETTISCGTRP